MVDFLGKELNVGDEVVFTYYKCSDLYAGRIHSIKGKTIKIKTDTSYVMTIRKSGACGRIIKI